MMSPSDEERIIAMVDSFTKTVARNFSRNLKRAKANREWSYVKKKYKLNMPFLVLSYPAKASALLSNAA